MTKWDFGLYKDKLKTREHTYRMLFDLMDKRSPKVIVETGTLRRPSVEDGREIEWRGDGASTFMFAHWAQSNGAEFYSCDINSETVEYSKEVLTKNGLSCKYTVGDSIEFLTKFPKKIDVLYLDSYNFDPNNPIPAMQHCLNEVAAAQDKLHDKTIIAIDDLFGTVQFPQGKPALAIPYLIKNGWKVVAANRQIIFAKTQ